jgi:hypothetical protein
MMVDESNDGKACAVPNDQPYAHWDALLSAPAIYSSRPGIVESGMMPGCPLIGEVRADLLFAVRFGFRFHLRQLAI